MKEIKVGLIKGRHEMPVDKYIFEDEIKDVFDTSFISSSIVQFLNNEVGIDIADFGTCLNQYEMSDVAHFIGKHKLVVYVTGLSIVLAELIRLCAINGVHLTLMHYNNSTKEYVSQYIF